jgi:hypothetical protein
VSDIPEGRGVLVRVLRVGVDGTGKEINAAASGEAPEQSPRRADAKIGGYAGTSYGASRTRTGDLLGAMKRCALAGDL